MLDITEHKRHADQLSDFLPWAALVAPHVILNKDGSFQATIRYRGPDLDSATKEELIVQSIHINNIIRRLGTGWALYAESQRKLVEQYPASEFPDPISTLIDYQRKLAFEASAHFESEYYLTLVYLPPAERTTKVVGMFLHTEAGHEINYRSILTNFENEVEQIADLLNKILPEVQVLRDSELLTHLHSTVSPKRHPIAVPETPVYLDSILADAPLLGGFKPQLGDHFIASIGIINFPGVSCPGLLDKINHLPVEYRWVTRFVCLDKADAKREIDKIQWKWFGKRKSLLTIVKEIATKEEGLAADHDALAKSHDAQEAIASMGSDELSFGYFTSTIVLLHKDPELLRAHAAEVERIINSQGFTAKREYVNAVDSWLGSIPGCVRRNPRRHILSTMNLSHLLPGGNAIWSGQHSNRHLQGGPLLVASTTGSTPFRFVNHVDDVGHTLILGPTGSGKSTLLNFIEVQFLRYQDAHVYIFDKGGSAFTLTTAIGGDYYDLGAEDGAISFQPLASVDDSSERKWAHDWLVAIAESENITITPEIKRTIWDALTSLAATPKEQRTIYAFTVYLQHPTLRAAFEPYTQTGSYGRLIDNTKDNLSTSRWQCFEMERLMDTPAVIGPILSYLFHRLETRFTGAPTLLVLDEAWLFLDHPVFASRIREWLKTLRKLNVSVVFATQSLSDVEASSIAPTIKEACFTKVYLPNSVALQPDATDFYTRFGLNKRQIEILSFATPKQDYYYTSPLGNRLFDLNLDDLALAYCAGASREQTALVRRLSEETSDTLDFNIRYLEHKGLTEAAQALRQLSDRRLAA